MNSLHNTIIMKLFNYLFVMLAGMSAFAQSETENTAHLFNSNRPDGHAPISIMGDHTHGAGEFMFSYRFSTTTMEGLQRGSENVSFASVLRPNGGQYLVTPTEMTMNMHMLGAMYGLTDRLTLTAMTSYMDMEMDHITAMGGTFTTESSGIGDTSITAIYNAIKRPRQRVLLQAGISLPTGSIDNEDVTPASGGVDVILPYPMQIGSGTFDGILAGTFLGQTSCFSYGSQVSARIRLGGVNDNGYQLGNIAKLNTWIAFPVSDYISLSGRVEARKVEDIDGVNPELNRFMVITADTSNSGGEFLDAGLGLNFYVPRGSLKNFRIGLEYTQPVIQNLNGVQLKAQEVFTAGIQYAF